MRLALVVPRYGADVIGGAESLFRTYAEHLAAAGHNVEVLTTCASDHRTWENDLPAGRSVIRGVPVHRFPVSERRDYASFASLSSRLQYGFALSRDEEREWLRNQGESAGLLEAIERTGPHVDLVMFAPYLFPSTCLGALICPDRSVVVPCLHDEAYARFDAVRSALTQVRGLLFNSDAECALAKRLIGPLPAYRICGGGIDLPTRVDPDGVRRRHGLAGDLVAFAGRRELGKGYPLLAEWIVAYERLRNQNGAVTLVSMGSGSLRLPSYTGTVIRDVGSVSETEKMDLLAAAVATAQPSRRESFSLVLLESFVCGTPAIVHADCAVTRAHCEESGGGVWIREAEEFAEALDRLRSDPALRARMGAGGRRYALSRYSWPVVTARLSAALQGLAA